MRPRAHTRALRIAWAVRGDYAWRHHDQPPETGMDKDPVSKPLYKSLYFQVITAIIIGVLLGHFAPATGEAMKPLGDGFIKLIKMIIAPIIFCTVVTGHCRHGRHEESRQDVGGKALLYFEVVSTLALIIGLVTVNIAASPERGNECRRRRASTPIASPTIRPGQPRSQGVGRIPDEHHSRAPWSMPSRKATFCRCCCSRCCSALRCTCLRRENAGALVVRVHRERCLT